MAKRKPTDKTQSQQSARDEAKTQQTVETASSLTVATSYSRQDMLAFLALGLLVVVSYLPAMLWGGFVWDDNLCIKVDPVREVSGLQQIWFSPSAIEAENHYWPLVYTTFWLEHKLWGFDPTGYHIVNVLLHLVNTLLLWHLLRRLAVPGAWVVAAVFAVHPLHVESVAWIIERKDVLSGLFYLGAMLAWMRFVEQANPRWYVGSLVLYAAGLLSKSIVVTLPAVLLIWHWWKQGRVTSTDLLRLVPFFAVGLVIVLGDLSFYRSESPTSLDYSLIERALIASRALWFYAGKLLWPSELSVIYPRWDIRVSDPLAWGYLIAAVALVLALWHFRSRIGRGPLAGALFFAITLSPILGFVDYGYMNYAFVADRFQYLAGIGVMAVVIGAAACGAGRLPDLWQKGVLGVTAVVIVVLGLLTWRQANIWKDEETLNRHIIELNPEARNAHRHLAKALSNQERYEEALEPALIAVEQRPDYFRAHVTLGLILVELSRFEEAETHLRRAIELNSETHSTRLNLSDLLYNQGRYEEALDVARAAVEQHPDSFASHGLLGALLTELGRFEEAETHLRRTIALNPQAPKAHFNLGEALHNQGRYEEAVDAYRVAIEQGLDDALAHSNLGMVFIKLERFEEAETHLSRAIALDPRHTEALYALAKLRFQQQRYDEMLKLYQQIIDIDPTDALAYGDMGVALFLLGRNDEALRSFDQALSLDPTMKGVRANRDALLGAMEGSVE